jgi:hypothetical protein
MNNVLAKFDAVATAPAAIVDMVDRYAEQLTGIGKPVLTMLNIKLIMSDSDKAAFRAYECKCNAAGYSLSRTVERGYASMETAERAGVKCPRKVYGTGGTSGFPARFE